MFPIHVVHLDLDKIPVVFVVQRHHLIKSVLVAVERESKLADMSCLTLTQQELHYSGVLKTVAEIVAVLDGVQQIVVYVVCLEYLQ